MQRLPTLKPKEVRRALERAGFFVHHATGSHFILRHTERPGVRVTLPYHRKDLKRRTLDSILDQAGLSHEEFLGLL